MNDKAFGKKIPRERSEQGRLFFQNKRSLRSRLLGQNCYSELSQQTASNNFFTQELSTAHNFLKESAIEVAIPG